MPTAAVLPTPSGLAVHAAGQSRVLPWPVARGLLDDPELVLHTVGIGDLSPWECERLLIALAVGDPEAERIVGGVWPPDRQPVHALRRHPRPWAHTVDLGVIAGDLAAACCRAGLALPGDDPLRAVDAIGQLMERGRGQLAVRRRLLDDHPWIGDAAWLSATGLLAETVVLQGLRREQVQRPVAAGGMAVEDLLGGAARFTARRADVRTAMAAILGGQARWSDRGHLSLKPAGGWLHEVAGVQLALGVGGLHSTDPPGVVEGPLVDLDVASYYPSLIAGDGIAPPQLPDFANRVGALMARRLAAKRAGDATASQALKLVINSLYGQLGNRRSGLFSPADSLRVVLTGQLRLLELIDGALACGCRLVSANTDGVLVRGDPESAAAAWEARTGLALERTRYAGLWRTSVNDYVACGPDGAVAKARGRFAGGDDEDATRRAAAPIVARAAVERLVHGRPLAGTVAAAGRVADFAMWRHARDLAWDGRAITGSVVRWVVSHRGRPLVQAGADRSPTTVAARAVLLPDPDRLDPALLDRDWYLREAQSLVDRVLGTTQGVRQLSLLDG